MSMHKCDKWCGHSDCGAHCERVRRRIECLECGYPLSEAMVSNNLNVQHTGCQKEFHQKIIEFVKSITPRGTRLLIENRTPFSVLDLDLCCDGAVYDQGYYCGKIPRHTGECYSFNKNVPFNRTNKS